MQDLQKIIADDDEKIGDHCHITGKLRGAASNTNQHKSSIN